MFLGHNNGGGKVAVPENLPKTVASGICVIKEQEGFFCIPGSSWLWALLGTLDR